MVTLTVDPQLFPDPESAHRYVHEKRAISVLVNALRKAGVLLGGHYFCVVEWQKKSEMAHYHLLVEAERIPFGLLCELWNRNRPKSAGPITGNRPGFGSVRFSKPNFKNNLHAACYATKYLIKHPKDGYPDWVMKYQGRIKRYTTSHGFWKSAEQVEQIEEHEEQIEELEEQAVQVVSKPDADQEQIRPRKKSRTIGERLESCCREAIILCVTRLLDEAGEITETQSYFGDCCPSYADIRRCLGIPVADPIRRIGVSQRTMLRLVFPKRFGTLEEMDS